MNDQQIAAKAWRNLARQTVRKINFGWWLDRFSPLLIFAGIVMAVAILVVRSLGHPIASLPLLIAGGAGLLALGIAAWVVAKRRFLQESQGLVRLEDRMNLKNALTTADRGVGRWPAPPEISDEIDAGLEWNWMRVFSPFALVALAITAAILIPISSVDAAKPPPSEPLAWAQMEEWMELLEEEDLIDESSIEEVKEKIEELRNQPEDEWFSHSSLEASDTLRQSLQRQIQDLGAELANAERDLNALQNFSNQLSEGTKDQLMAEYDQALQNLALNKLSLNPELMKMLEGIDPSQLAQGKMSQMSEAQLNELREALRKAAGT